MIRALTTALLASLLGACTSGPEPPPLSSMGEELTFLTLSGGELDLLELPPDRPTLFLFWQPDSDDFLRDLPELAEKERELAERMNLVGVLSGSAAVADPLTARGLVLRHGIEFPQVIDVERKLEDALDAHSDPLFIIVETNGEVSFRGRYLGDRY